jgi:hypothetical protein
MLRRIDARMLELMPRGDSKREKKQRRRAKRAEEVAAQPPVAAPVLSKDDDNDDEDAADDDDVGVDVERLEINLTPTWCELGRAAGHARPRTMHQKEALEAPPLPDPSAVAKPLYPFTLPSALPEPPPPLSTPEPPTPAEPEQLPTPPALPETPLSTRSPSPEPPPPNTAAPSPQSTQHDLECNLCMIEGVGRAVLSCSCSKACFKCTTEALAASKTSTCPFCRRDDVFVMLDKVFF